MLFRSLDAHFLALRRVYLADLEESIVGSDFRPTTEFQKVKKVESETMKLAVMKFKKYSRTVTYFQAPSTKMWMLKDV